jgi:hypothetical protein
MLFTLHFIRHVYLSYHIFLFFLRFIVVWKFIFLLSKTQLRVYIVRFDTLVTLDSLEGAIDTTVNATVITDIFTVVIGIHNTIDQELI